MMLPSLEEPLTMKMPKMWLVSLEALLRAELLVVLSVSVLV